MKKATNSKKERAKKRKEKIDSMHMTKRLSRCLITGLIFLLLLIIRLFWIQFVQGSSLKEMAYKQQTTNTVISPKRGTIYDSTGKALAISAKVDTVSIHPGKVKYSNGTLVDSEKLANIFTSVFDLDYNETLEKINSKASIVMIAKRVEKDKIDLLKETLSQNDITSGVNIDEDTKRYYPYDNLASNLIGFYGTDRGLEGLENRWDSVLTGTSGKIVTSTDSISREIPNQQQTYIPAQNGSDLTLTIDLTIQTIAEKYLKQAVIENSCARGGTVIIMQPSTGDILAMASYPDYNLNSPFDVEDTAVWKNMAIQNTYEPGSTFKLINAAIGLEEGIVDTDTKTFNCAGFEQFTDGTIINCWRYSNPHGSQSLRESLMNSCNPSFMQLGKRLGARTLYKYYEAFGLFSPTGIASSGESSSIFHRIGNIGETELATMSFGQRFNITPLQLITAVSAIANDGVLMQPRIVKEITNTDTGAVTTIDPVAVRQVVSKETSIKMLSMMESVVTEGTGRYGAVSGYSVGGKTGTSEPNPDKPEEGYTASYIAVSPTTNPEVIVLVTLYNPQGKSYQGGSIAGPIASQILSEVLPYLGIASSSNTSNSQPTSYTTKTLPDVRNKTVSDARTQLKNAGFNVVFNGVNENESEAIVIDQVPKPGSKLLNDSTVCLYTENNNVRLPVEVPDLKGMSVLQAKNALKAKRLNISIEGTGIVINQDPLSTTSVEEGSIVRVTLKEKIQDTH